MQALDIPVRAEPPNTERFGRQNIGVSSRIQLRPEVALDQEVRVSESIGLRQAAYFGLQQCLDAAVIVAFRNISWTIDFRTRKADEQMRQHFGDEYETYFRDHVDEWLQASGENALIVDSRGGSLRVRAFVDPTRPGFAIFLLKRTCCCGKSVVGILKEHLGLTVREAEVLFWIAEGKTSPEIAIILRAARTTIKKHVQNILSKLGLENRLAAALAVKELLGEYSLDPETWTQPEL